VTRTLIIGLGSGRCGTNTLAALLDMQADTEVTHERFGTELQWAGSEERVSAMVAAADASVCARHGDVHSAYLPYAPQVLAMRFDVRLICLRRDREATVSSFIDKTARKANHWAPTQRLDRHTRWNACFPTYSVDLSKAEAIGRYWDEYYLSSERLAHEHPDRFAIFPTTALSNEAGQRSILEFIGIEPELQRVEPGMRLNIERPRRHGLAKILDWF
jgi:hypothetical protein